MLCFHNNNNLNGILILCPMLDPLGVGDCTPCTRKSMVACHVSAQPYNSTFNLSLCCMADDGKTVAYVILMVNEATFLKHRQLQVIRKLKAFSLHMSHSIFIIKACNRELGIIIHKGGTISCCGSSHKV